MVVFTGKDFTVVVLDLVAVLAFIVVVVEVVGFFDDEVVVLVVVLEVFLVLVAVDFGLDTGGKHRISPGPNVEQLIVGLRV